MASLSSPASTKKPQKQRSPPNSLPSWNHKFLESRQLQNQDREHAFDVDGLLRERFVVVGWNECQISGQQELILQFAGGAFRNGTKACQFGISVSTAPLGD